jgi:hypothetical protein
MQPAVELREVADSTWHPPAWCAWPYAFGARKLDVASLWGVVGQFGHTLFNRYLYERYTTYSCTKTFFKPSTKHDPIDPSRHVIRLLALFAITPRNTPLGAPRQNFRKTMLDNYQQHDYNYQHDVNKRRQWGGNLDLAITPRLPNALRHKMRRKRHHVED